MTSLSPFYPAALKKTYFKGLHQHILSDKRPDWTWNSDGSILRKIVDKPIHAPSLVNHVHLKKGKPQ